MTLIPAIVIRRWHQRALIRGMGGSVWNQWRMFFLGKSGKFAPTRKVRHGIHTSANTP